MSVNITEIFGSNVFSTDVMRERLPKGVFREVMDVMEHGGNISIETADIVANAMKDWAVEKGATHYTHWFQPLTGITAEKHDAFLTRPENSRTLLQLTGKQLIMGESDASSFPSGGLRSTHYARGYTAWDMTSPAFVKEMTAGTILCIPTIFVSYHGEALDKKTPLLRSMQALSTQALRILRLFGNTAARKVIPQVGAEQEYFLVDREKYLKRRDLIYTGRTLFGAPAPKGQEMDDQYFGVIRPRVGSFMSDLNQELWKLGIPITTQHNEAAPAQHELAPIYTPCNLAVDQNQLTMETMKRVATRHGLVCLLHEKPFVGVNGSGKHDNWSLNTDTGKNLFKPGKTPSQNAQFLLFLAAFVKGVDEYQDFLRATVAFPGNDHRLGASEAPPAVLSIFLGDELDAIVQSIIRGTEFKEAGKRTLQIGVDAMPPIPQDNTDRNRTSPMAFTGNKFEFRMLGSSQSISGPNIALNTIMAEELQQFADQLEKSKNFQSDLEKLIKKVFTDHQRIIFNGNGYDDAWIKEATEKRGLLNLRTTPDALATVLEKKNVEMLTSLKIFSEAEIRSRYEICLENYCKTVNIEGLTMVDMARKEILPAVEAYLGNLSGTVAAKTAAVPGLACKYEKDLISKLSKLADEISDAASSLDTTLIRLKAIPDVTDAAYVIRDVVLQKMAELRVVCDETESITADKYWPFPTYGDLLFGVR